MDKVHHANMRKLGAYFTALFVLCVSPNQGQALFIDGCPMFGCRPSGSFSFYLQVPRNNVSIKWASDIFDPVPTNLGCAANSYSLICPNNGPFSGDKGYRSLFPSNGTTRWRDSKLHFPTLPLLDNYGDVTGSDGVNLVHYDADGTKYPVIPCDDLRPMFSMALVGTSYLLFVSGSGFIVVRQTNGVPLGSIALNATIQNINGSFIPIAQPVINVQRFYVLTKFVPLKQYSTDKESHDHLRLYAIDVRADIANRIVVMWHMDIPETRPVGGLNTKRFTPHDKKYANNMRIMNSEGISNGTQALLWNRYNNTVYVTTGETPDSRRLTGIQDEGSTPKIAFQSKIDVLHMAMFVSDHCENLLSVSEPVLWTSNGRNLIQQVSLQGAITRTINISEIFNFSASMTTKLTVIRNSDDDRDVLVFGITRDNVLKRNAKMDTQSYIVALNTTAALSKAMLDWSIPLPDKLTARGQIVGVKGVDSGAADQIIIYADDTNISARIFSISS